MHDPRIEEEAREYLDRVDGVTDRWTRSDVFRHLVAFAEYMRAVDSADRRRRSGSSDQTGRGSTG